jgi:hypothetical protein
MADQRTVIDQGGKNATQPPNGKDEQWRSAATASPPGPEDMPEHLSTDDPTLEDAVDVAGADSFPASDPPSYSAGSTAS